LEQKLNYENALLEYNRQRLESEKRKRFENKLTLKKDIEQQLEIANEKHKMQNVQKMNNQQEVIYLNQQKALQEIMKEESYKKVDICFFF
jgi:cupin superfamily acireductone dioxygenase involved in methionine salvage